MVWKEKVEERECEEEYEEQEGERIYIGKERERDTTGEICWSLEA